MLRVLLKTWAGRLVFTATISQSAPRVVFDSVNSLTNADTGALFSWHAFQQGYCALSVDSSTPLQPNPQCQATVNTLIDNHLTTTAGTAIAADVIWQPPVVTPFAAVSPVLQLADGSFVGSAGFSPNMIAFDAAGNTRWVVPGYNPQMATADGGIIGQAGSTFDPGSGSFLPGPAATFDGNGSATGQVANLPQFPSWMGNGYDLGSADQIAFPSLSLVGSFAALFGGNHSGNGTAIQQVLTKQPQVFEKQLPEIGGGPLFGNINMIDFRTDKSADYIFQKYIQTYAAVIRNPGDAQPFRNTVSFLTNSPSNPGYTGPDAIDVTGLNQVLTITLRGIAKLGQGPFSIMTERFDPTNHVISVVTLKGHPLSGWRYWRVYPMGINDILIETGAFDTPGPGTKNFIGYFLGQGTVSKMWHEYMEYLERQPDLNAQPGSLPFIDVASKGKLVSVTTLLNGLWDYTGLYTDYLLDNVCQAPPGSLTCH